MIKAIAFAVCTCVNIGCMTAIFIALINREDIESFSPVPVVLPALMFELLMILALYGV